MTDRDVYTHGHHESVVESHATRTVADSAMYLVPHLRSGASLIDVGCGPGTVTRELAERLAPGAVLGIDNSPEVIDRARARATPDNLRFDTMDLYALDVADDSYDICHAHQVLQHVTNPVAALREMRRVVRPGGIVAVRDADYAAMHWSPQSDPLDRWMSIYRHVARSNRAEPDAGRHLKRWAIEAGFSSITPTISTWLYETPERCAWLASTWASRSTESAFATQAVADGVATTDELDAVADGWRAWAAGPHPWFVMVHGELICTA